MSAWDYELAKELRQLPEGGRPELMEGTVVSTAPVTVALYGGEVMAPPAPLQALACTRGFYRDKDTGHLMEEPYKAGDRVLCAWMGKTVVLIGRLQPPEEQIEER